MTVNFKSNFTYWALGAYISIPYLIAVIVYCLKVYFKKRHQLLLQTAFVTSLFLCYTIVVGVIYIDEVVYSARASMIVRICSAWLFLYPTIIILQIIVVKKLMIFCQRNKWVVRLGYFLVITVFLSSVTCCVAITISDIYTDNDKVSRLVYEIACVFTWVVSVSTCYGFNYYVCRKLVCSVKSLNPEAVNICKKWRWRLYTIAIVIFFSGVLAIVSVLLDNLKITTFLPVVQIPAFSLYLSLGLCFQYHIRSLMKLRRSNASIVARYKLNVANIPNSTSSMLSSEAPTLSQKGSFATQASGQNSCSAMLERSNQSYNYHVHKRLIDPSVVSDNNIMDDHNCPLDGTIVSDSDLKLQNNIGMYLDPSTHIIEHPDEKMSKV